MMDEWMDKRLSMRRGGVDTLVYGGLPPTISGSSPPVGVQTDHTALARGRQINAPGRKGPTQPPTPREYTTAYSSDGRRPGRRARGAGTGEGLKWAGPSLADKSAEDVKDGGDNDLLG